ncbi:A-kinase anchor protein 9 isoform X3 [Pleurodeles waltl]|uniref:A-kinase anchor protein 9 isoform X3 n=1 Tax=Pleurodeles waltl TaxID=8319 RepID=UPI00370991C8
MEDEERQKKLEAGKAKLAQFRQRKAQVDGHIPKKQKKKKKSTGSKESDLSEDGPDFSQTQSNDSNAQNTQRGSAPTKEFTILRTLHSGDTIKHDQTYTIEPESEISTTADDYSSEEEEFGAGESYSEHGIQNAQTRLEGMEDELAGKQQEIEELSRELEEMRAAYGSEGLQQLQEFETAIKQRDGIITQLTANLQQARKEKDEIMREFLELTEQSQKLKIQFQHLQAGETLRNTSHTSTAADLLHAKQQILTHQQQLDEQALQIKSYERHNEEYQKQITVLQDRIKYHQAIEVERSNEVENCYKKELLERDEIIEGLKRTLTVEEKNVFQLKESLLAANRSLEELKEKITVKNQETYNLTIELTNSRQKERQSSEEIKQLMGSVEALQKQYHKGSLAEIKIAQKTEMEVQKKLEQLRAELDEMYGQQIVQMKQELVNQHLLEISKIMAQHKEEEKQTGLEHSSSEALNEEQVNLMNSAINELNVKLQDANFQRDKVTQELSQKLETMSSEKVSLQIKIEDLLQELEYAREQIRRAKENIADKEGKLSEADKFQDTIDDLKVQIASASEFIKDLESKHEAEVTNYKIKLEMLEREKDAVLDRMAESQEAELERLRTQLLFSHEEELSKLKEDLEIEHRTNIENLKDNLAGQYKHQLDSVQKELTEQMNAMQYENDSLITKQNQLLLEISKLNDLQQSVVNSKSEEMSFQILELQKEIEILRKGEKEKGSLEDEVQELQLKVELLEKELKNQEAHFNEKCTELKLHNRLLNDENLTSRENPKQDILETRKEPLISIGSVFSSDNTIELQKEIEKLTVEKEQLRKQGIQLKEEIKRQRNTFSFAEKNFEVNYQELKEEYACLNKVKTDLELSKIKQEAEYESKLKALNDDLKRLQKNQEAVFEIKKMVPEDLKDSPAFRADNDDGGVVVEKDTTELMEKLEIAQREKLELSVRLSDLTEQLNLKHSEIVQLNENISFLKQEKESMLMRCNELEVSSHNTLECQKACNHDIDREREILSTDLFISNVSSQFYPGTVVKNNEEDRSDLDRSLRVLLTTDKEKQAYSKLIEENQSLLDQLHQVTEKLSHQSLLVLSAQQRMKELEQHLDILKSEQEDVRLLMEAQRISLTQIHSAYLEVVCENLRAEKEEALNELRNQLISTGEEEKEELRVLHQQELQDLLGQQSDNESQSSEMLIKRLTKAVTDESTLLTQYLLSALGEKCTSAGKLEVNVNDELVPEARVTERAEVLNLQVHMAEAQEIQANMQTLVAQVKEDYRRLIELRSRLTLDSEKIEKLHSAYSKEHGSEEAVAFLRPQSNWPSSNCQDTSGFKEHLHIQGEPLEEVEKLKLEFSQQRTYLEEQHSQKIEHLRTYFQQQLKDTEERYTTEMIHLQEQLHDVKVSDIHTRELTGLQLKTEQSVEDYQRTDLFLAPRTSSLEINEPELAEECSLKVPSGPIQQLQTLRQSLASKYMQEVNYLKIQHQEELEKLASTLKEQYSVENAELRKEILQLTKCKQENLNGGVRLHCDMEDNDCNNVIGLVEKLYQERIADEVAKVIVEMTVSFAQKSELARIAKLQEDEVRNQHTQINDQWEESESTFYNEVQLRESTTVGVGKERSYCHLEDSSSNHLLSFREREMACSRESLPGYFNPVLMETTLGDGVASSSIQTAKLELLYEERVEDMRQELVRQEQEHQQAAESLRQAHMLQMERQREDQEQLLEELSKLKGQLSRIMSASVVNESLVTEREATLLHELEALEHVPAAGREVCLELLEACTQTQSEDDAGSKPKEQSLGDGTGRESETVTETHASELTKERQGLQKANNRLLKILLEVVKMTVAVEETIGHHVNRLLDKSGKSHPPSRVILWEPDAEMHVKPCVLEGLIAEEPADSCHGSDAGGDDNSIWSGGTEEGLELSQRLADSGFAGVDLDPENEELVLNISARLQAAVEKLLEAINETSNQLEHAKATQTELVRESIKRKKEITELLRSQDELQERLAEEAKAREHLASELSKAEGLLDGYSDDRVSLEKQVQEKTDLIHRLEQELQSTGNRLQELEEERQLVQDERELLSRQKNAMKADAGPAELQLLEETEKLMKEKIEVQRQAEKEHEDLQKQLKILESDLEEQVNRYIELEQERNEDIADLRQKNQALEKQLDKTRRFLDEQAMDREHERDVFQQEIQELEQQLKIPQRQQPVNDDQTREVERLSNYLKEKTDKCSELLLSKEQLQRDVQERNEEIEKLECRIRELEQALIISSDDLQKKVEERKHLTVIEVKGELPLEAQLQVEREAIDRKENEITNLEEQLEQFREELENKIEEVQQLHMQLEIQRKESTTRLQELELENALFKDELDNLRIGAHASETDSSVKDLFSYSGKLAQIMQEKDKEIDNLNEQITQLQQHLENATDNKVIEEKNEQIGELEARIECLKSEQERVKRSSAEEIEQLNDVIEKLQQELANIEGKVPVDVSGMSEDGDSLKHQLESVIVENRILQQKVDNNDAEVKLTKRELKEANNKINLLKEQLAIWKQEHGTVGEKSMGALRNSHDILIEGGSTDKADKLETALRENVVHGITHQVLLNSVEEAAQDTINSMELKLRELQEEVREKDQKLCECHSQLAFLKEQAESERDALEHRLLDMEDTMRHNVAAALVSEAQLKAIQIQTKYIQEMAAKPVDIEDLLNRSQMQSTSEARAELESSELTVRLLEMNNQLIEMHKQLEFEKEQVTAAQKEAIEKEDRLLELRRIMKEMQQSQTEKDTQELLKEGQGSAEEKHGTDQSTSAIQLQFEMEKIKVEAAAVKEELNSFREKTEKLEEELMVKETSFACLQEDLRHVKQSLAEAEIKLACYVQHSEQHSEQDQNTGVDPVNVLSVDGSYLIRAASSSQTETPVSVNNSNQTIAVHQKDAEIQIDLAGPDNVSSETVTEVISQFTEKIGQMQELHAAEIMDMESRHISEADTLRREQYVAIQALTEECDALRAVIESLSTKQGIPVSGVTHPASFHNTDGSSSDAGSDWSLKGETEATSELVPDKIKNLLRAVHREGIQVLSLSELPNAEKDLLSVVEGTEEWNEERRRFLNAIVSLKDLIAKMQVHRKAEIDESSDLAEQIPDWRGELLCAIQDVFLKEQDVLVAAFRTQLAAMGTTNTAVLVNQLQERLQEQGMEHINAMDCINNADRRSLLLEIQSLRAQKRSLQMDPKNATEIDAKSQGLMQYNVPTECSPLHKKLPEIRGTKAQSTELHEQLHSERLIAELKKELAQTTLELDSALKLQHMHFKELELLRAGMAEKASALDALNDTIAHEQKKTRELQWALEKEKAKMERLEKRGQEELEDLTFALEDHKVKILQLSELLEQEKRLVLELHQKIESQEAQLSQERSRNAESQVILEAERVRAVELNSALEREKELYAQLQSAGEKEHSSVQDSHGTLIIELQSQLEEKHNRIVELVTEKEAQNLETLQLGQKLEEERRSCKKTLLMEQEANKSSQKKIEELQLKVEELQWQLEEKLQQVQKLQEQDRLLQERIQVLLSKEKDDKKTNQSESEQENVLSNVTEWDTSSDRTKSWILQQKEEASERKESGFSTQIEMNGGDVMSGSDAAVENIKHRLQQVSSKLKHLASKAAKRIQFESADDEDFVWMQNSLQDVLSQLQRLPEFPSLGEGEIPPPDGSPRSLTERLLKQNADLTGYVSRLTEEKNDLRNLLIQLEEELRRYRDRSAARDHTSGHLLDNEVNIDALIGSEREMWNREKKALQKSLKQAEAELSKLRAELRSDSLQRDLGGDSENMALRRMYGKYLRSESFRKALIYQKKYLLLLLGGFQECEEATLALIARMGGQPCYTDLETITHHSRGFTRFRSAVRVSIAISRMKFLVRRWQRAMGPSSMTVNRNGFAQSPANDMRTDSPYLPTGGMDVYSEQRLSSGRSRSGIESPRSAGTSHHRYHGGPVDLGPCSHLQNYDPDRALTDYINRLESLQRRLGSVHSGSPSVHNQVHYVTRR